MTKGHKNKSKPTIFFLSDSEKKKILLYITDKYADDVHKFTVTPQLLNLTLETDYLRHSQAKFLHRKDIYAFIYNHY